MPSPWKEHPKLRGRFHPEFPEDLQVIVHDASPAKSGGCAELVWVRVTGCDDEIFSGIVLNKPSHLRCGRILVDLVHCAGGRTVPVAGHTQISA